MTVFRLRIVSLSGVQEIEHAGGPLEIGRGPARDGASRVVVDDPWVSRDHLRLTPVAGDLVRVENLSPHVPVIVGSGTALAPGDMVTVLVPIDLALGDTKVEVKLARGKPFPMKPPAADRSAGHWANSIRATELPNTELHGTGFEVPLPPRSPTSANDILAGMPDVTDLSEQLMLPEPPSTVPTRADPTQLDWAAHDRRPPVNLGYEIVTSPRDPTTQSSATSLPDPLRPTDPPPFTPLPQLTPHNRRWYDPRTWSRPVADIVGCTVFAPSRVSAGSPVLVQVFVHLPGCVDEARRVALEQDPNANRRGGTTLQAVVPRRSELAVHLSIPRFRLASDWEQVVWNGRTDHVAFAASAPDDAPSRSAVGTVTVWRDGWPVGHVRFILFVYPFDQPHPPPRQTGLDVVPYRKVFVSYASADRDRVLDRVQGILRYDPRADLFMDVLNLDPGERWERELYRRIDECDLFLLCWSAKARESEWVRRELRYALGRQAKGGGDPAPPAIRPLLLDGPPPPDPWDEMKSLHVNDPLLYFRSR